MVPGLLRPAPHEANFIILLGTPPGQFSPTPDPKGKAHGVMATRLDLDCGDDSERRSPKKKTDALHVVDEVGARAQEIEPDVGQLVAEGALLCGN